MPYIVKRGKVEDGEHVYAVGDRLPDEIVDDAMIEAGSVEPAGAGGTQGPYAGLTRKELFALCAAREIEAPARAKVDELRELLAASDAGDSHGKDDEDDAGEDE